MGVSPAAIRALEGKLKGRSIDRGRSSDVGIPKGVSLELGIPIGNVFVPPVPVVTGVGVGVSVVGVGVGVGVPVVGVGVGVGVPVVGVGVGGATSLSVIATVTPGTTSALYLVSVLFTL